MNDYEKEDERSEKAEKMTDEEEGEGEWTLVVDDEVEVEDGDGDGDGRREKEKRQGKAGGMLVYRLLIARIGKTERALETDQTNNHACARGLSPPKVPKVACYTLFPWPACLPIVTCIPAYLHTCMLFLLDREVSIILPII
ncbi:hypothetical protein BDDG_06758 [Blastomyces dermatitidis ATCC 18188]|uniref:Uncharacterized protein n=1 Tax=Ajellomyces dermatitidis (strain ATCC 18188 / CBS 674.68) TaxID=653446 RepID=F2TKQ0_AJEDA|nr:hypothetical protein BDDG_06758 [Blastomyces dermatitidis ATCC 18188]